MLSVQFESYVNETTQMVRLSFVERALGVALEEAITEKIEKDFQGICGNYHTVPDLRNRNASISIDELFWLIWRISREGNLASLRAIWVIAQLLSPEIDWEELGVYKAESPQKHYSGSEFTEYIVDGLSAWASHSDEIAPFFQYCRQVK